MSSACRATPIEMKIAQAVSKSAYMATGHTGSLQQQHTVATTVSNTNQPSAKKNAATVVIEVGFASCHPYPIM